MEKQELKTIAVKGGEMIEAEPVNYCGLQDFCQVTHLQDGMLYLVRHFIEESEGMTWGDEIVSRISALCTAIGDVSYYRTNYLIRRIEMLEDALGLKHCRDIVPTAMYFEDI